MAGGFAKYRIEPIGLDFAQGMVNNLKVVQQLVRDCEAALQRSGIANAAQPTIQAQRS